ncbi:S-layer homology domain-containing protein [Paenibacillus sp. GCM10027626]|uniref:NHL domain-containing protein n=1 Tax=Paenibacillus sp. GCM10027626 TaxID=3273411 RepID=UPI00363314AA
MRLYVYFYMELQYHRNLPWEGKKIRKRIKKLMASVLAFLLITSVVPELSGGKVHAASGYTINTAAGIGTNGYSGDGGPATLAELYNPSGVAIDSSGNLYIADSSNHRVRKVDASGKISTIAGTGTGGYSGDGGPATSASLNNPYGLTIDSIGNLYISDYSNHSIRKVDVSGKISTVAGMGRDGYSGDGGPATSAQLSYPDGVAVDRSGNLYIADKGNHRIRKVDTLGTISTVAGTGGRGYSGDEGNAVLAQLNFPTGVAVDSIGNLYISDYFNYCIRKVDVSGKISTVAGIGGSYGFSGDGGPATSARLSLPDGVAVDSIGNLYLSDRSNSRVRKVDTSGKISTIAGTGRYGYSGDGGPATSADLSDAYGMAIDRSGNLYIADVLNNRIRKLSLQTVVAFAASSIPGVGVDDPITLTVKNAYGNTDTSFSGEHEVTISGYLQAPDNSYGSLNGTALSASPNTISVMFNNGTATVKLKLNKAGAQTINISVADVASPANPLIITPVAGSAASMELTTDITAPASNGGAFAQQPVITLFDAYGNKSVGDNTTIVTASKKDTGAWTLTGAATARASAGVVTFSGLGATHAAMVTGAKLSFEAAGLSPIESAAVTLPAPIYSGKLITQLWPVPYDPDQPHLDDDSEKFKKIVGNVYLTNEPYADVLFTTKGVDQLEVFVDESSKGVALKDTSGNLVVTEGTSSLKIDASDPIMDTHLLRFVARPVTRTGNLINIRATSDARDDSESIVLLQAPTVISLDVPDQLEVGKSITIKGTIDTKASLPIRITTSLELFDTYTDDQGNFSYAFTAPSSAGNVTIQVEAPGVEQQLVKSWGVTVYEPLNISVPGTCNGTTGELFSCKFEATGGIGNRTWSIESGSLPAGIDLDRQTGLISGTPVSEGTYPITVAVMDSTGVKRTETITIHIESIVILPAPSGLKATAGDGEVILSWEPVTGATYYDIYEALAPGSYQKIERITNFTGSYSIKGLANNITRYYAVKAGNEDTESDYSAEVSATPQTPPDNEVPQWPVGSELMASDITQTSVKLSWPSAADNVKVTSYRIYVNDTERETVSSSVYATIVDGLKADTSYLFKVTAFDAAGNESAALTATAKTLQQPVEPDTEAPEWPEGSELAVSDITQTNVKLSWPSAMDNVGVTGYRIYVDGTERETVGGNVYAITVDGLTSDTKYTFKVTAYDAAGNESKAGLSKTATTSRSSSGGNDSGGNWGGGWYLSNNASLKALEIWTAGKRVSLTPSFSANSYSYKAETEAERIEVKVTADHAASKVTWQGKALGDVIQVDLQEGENVISLIVQAEDGSRKTYTLTVNRVMPKPEEPESPVLSFTDIAGHWAESGIKSAAAKGIVSGYPDGAFKPNDPVTRAEFTVMLAGALKLEGQGASLTFSDQNQIGAWAKQAIAQAVQSGIVNGYADGSFRSNDHITRSEMAVMIARALQLQRNAHASTGFADDEAIPQWAKGAIEAIHALGIVDGRGQNRFVPNETAMRAEATVMLLRMLDHKEG